MALGRVGDPNEVAPLVRICFMWAPRSWYFATVLSETTTPGWWNVQWDDDKTKHQILLSSNSSERAQRTFWFILEDQADERRIARLQRMQEKEQEALHY
jgi:hypothetical protein